MLILILIVDQNCIFILSILNISIHIGLYLGAGGIIFEMVWALIVRCRAYRWRFYYIGGFYKICLNLCTKHDGFVAIEKTGEQFFPRFLLTVCKPQPEILINIMNIH